ncbi:glyoxalase/bleomycin resistance/extradiol dioxygenase family protein [Roseivirga sp.]|uniref:glyoxalase/bleomycin resistance/extradiol dioxygenase family protein n=1 Tax=Roseivirga sp. TaxID=1964215 RepID=UPI003B520446
MHADPNIKGIEPVLPTTDIKRDLEWYEKYTGFVRAFGDDMYAGMVRDQLCIHLQWHADTPDDPLLGGSVIKIFVHDIMPWLNEFVERGTIKPEKLRKNTPWGTHEFGFYDLNKNAIFIVQDA